jgi:hypothetical protein
MIKIRAYQNTDRYNFENLVKNYYLEKKLTPPDNNQILETVAYYNSFSQCGKIYIIIYDNNIIGYCIASYYWKNRYSTISCLIDELYIDKNYNKYKLEIDLVEFLIKSEKMHSISIKFDELNSNSRKILKSIKFERDEHRTYRRLIEI